MNNREYQEAQKALEECRDKALDMLDNGKFDYVDRNHEEMERIQDYVRRNWGCN